MAAQFFDMAETPPGLAIPTFLAEWRSYGGVSTNLNATASEMIKPGQDTYIRVFNGPPPAGVSAFSADEIIAFVGSRVKRDPQ